MKKIYEVEFVGMWPSGNGLIIAADNKEEATKIVAETITHVDVFKIKEVDITESKVIYYDSGEY